MWERGTLLGGRYTLAERIGGGATGEVWRADDGVLERSVAVKILRPELLDDARFAKRFRREALILAALDHPGIVDIHDYGESVLGTGSESETGNGRSNGNRIAYIVMELVEGRTLDTYLRESGPLSPEQALSATAEALDALRAAHLQQVVHRDLKPSNLMVRADGRMKVTDFGIARDLATSRITFEHAVVGTALYIAPEQAEGSGTTPASDLYSMGVVCYEMLTGRPPFDGERAIELLYKHIEQPPPPLPVSFPEPVREFVATALAKKPEDRFADAATMAAAARVAASAARTSGFQTTTPGVPGVPAVGQNAEAASPVRTPRQRAERRRRLVLPLLVPCVVVVAVGGVLVIDRGPLRSQAGAPGGGASATSLASGASSASGSPSPSGRPSASVSGHAGPPSGSATTQGRHGSGGSSPSTAPTPNGGSGARPSGPASLAPSAYPISGVSMSDDSAALQGSEAAAGPGGGCTAWVDRAGGGDVYGMLNTSYFETCHAEVIRDDGVTVDLSASTGAERTSPVSDVGHTLRICVWQQGASADQQCSATVVTRNGTPTVE
ncbi:serine/threonine-protein kinase [Streptacidiphilus fuscans]|uniref:non-specific serine/threonine protein kinase n=1 Tax=Streptacidiphilus fuscans TaxID=2789292 RepID=A0A931BBM9_9ACTN|nr:serine/threonine-protein kinase [Streptacidiphilus fuscans]MBF9072646.1 serine/threonine protein kinase [Streptacidiphilus fuscans]